MDTAIEHPVPDRIKPSFLTSGHSDAQPYPYGNSEHQRVKILLTFITESVHIGLNCVKKKRPLAFSSVHFFYTSEIRPSV